MESFIKYIVDNPDLSQYSEAFKGFANGDPDLANYAAIQVGFEIFTMNEDIQEECLQQYISYNDNIIKENIRLCYFFEVGYTDSKSRIRSYKGHFKYRGSVRQYNDYIEREFDFSDNMSFFIGVMALAGKDTNQIVPESMKEVANRYFSQYFLLVSEDSLNLPALDLSEYLECFKIKKGMNLVNENKIILKLCNKKSFVLRFRSNGSSIWNVIAYTHRNNFSNLKEYLKNKLLETPHGKLVDYKDRDAALGR